MHKLLFIFILILSISCSPEAEEIGEIKNLPKSTFNKVMHPTDNSYSLQREELGRLLFYDPILSIDSSISCNSCHKQEYAFGDNKAVSLGVGNRMGNRNSPSLANVAYHPYYTREGGVPTLEQQVLVPLEENHEMAFNVLEVSKRIENNDFYRSLCDSAYPSKPYYFAITASLAQFQRSLISANSPFDAYVFEKEYSALNANEINGMRLFYSEKTNCFQCHSGPNLTSYVFENNGLYTDYNDKGRYKLTKDSKDLELFKIPSLRNTEMTAPYMHNGTFTTLEEVIEHYNLGGKENPNKSEFIKPLHLTQKEKSDLLLFLHTLTDNEFINNKDHQLK